MVVNRQNASIQEAARYCCPCCACIAFDMAPMRTNADCAHSQLGCPVLNLQTCNPVKVPAIGGDTHQPGRQRVRGG